MKNHPLTKKFQQYKKDVTEEIDNLMVDVARMRDKSKPSSYDEYEEDVLDFSWDNIVRGDKDGKC